MLCMNDRHTVHRHIVNRHTVNVRWIYCAFEMDTLCMHARHSVHVCCEC